MSSEKKHADLLLGNQLCFRLYSASHLIVKSYTPLLAKLGLTYPQYLVMMALWEHDEMRVNDLAKTLLLQTNTVTPLLKRMEAEGLVTRFKDQNDQRQVIVRLTDEGRRLEETASTIPKTQVERLLCNGAKEELIPGLSIRLDALIEVLKLMTKSE